jgi:hypothetical protein
MATFSFLLFTALVGYTNFKGKPILSFKWHPRLAATTIALAIIHAIMAASAYLEI